MWLGSKQLRPEDIPELQTSRSFRSFQTLIRESAAAVLRDEPPESYREELERRAAGIIEAWQQTKFGLSKGLRDALFVPAMTLSAQALRSLIEGAGGPSGLAIDGGVAIASLAYERWQAGAPYGYLTEIKKAENEYFRMMFPLGLEPWN